QRCADLGGRAAAAPGAAGYDLLRAVRLPVGQRPLWQSGAADRLDYLPSHDAGGVSPAAGDLVRPAGAAARAGTAAGGGPRSGPGGALAQSESDRSGVDRPDLVSGVPR